MKKTATLLLFACFFCLSLSAKHILGGYMTYRADLNGNLHFTMTIFRDCADPGGAQFDNPAVVSLYQGKSEPYTFYSNTTDLFLESVLTVVPSDLPPGCLLTPAHCIQLGIYKGFIPGPLPPDNYHLVYQRCCLSEVVANIVNPGDHGLTVSIEIPKNALQVKNTSPSLEKLVFFAFNNEPFDYGVHATDPDGDSLAYSFCFVPAGGGPVLSGAGVQGCYGVIPNPACPPPFDTVHFIEPTYTVQHPILANSPMEINPVNGEITGTPNTLGQNLYGVCITEYRNGQFLSETKAIFQLLVSACITGTAEPAALTFEIFPNPVSDIARMELPDDWEIFEVSDAQGRAHFFEKNRGQVLDKLDISGWPPGLYFLKIAAGNQVLFGKFAIQAK